MNLFQTIPVFPKFRRLKIGDAKIFNHINRLPLPYSDFNFVSLWSYNTEEDLLISQLNENIVIQMRNYITNQPLLSYIGNKKPLHTIESLVQYADQTIQTPQIHLIPRFNIKNTIAKLRQKFSVKLDRDNFDYILSLTKLASLEGSSFEKKRNKVYRFLKEYPQTVVEQIDLIDKKNDQFLLEVFARWNDHKGTDNSHEYQAIRRLLENSNSFNLICVGIYINNQLEAFTIVEVLPKKYAISHFTKADPKIIGIFEYLYKSTAEILIKKGCLYLNREQDLGLEGLRAAKMSWRPIKFLKKYTISKLN